MTLLPKLALIGFAGGMGALARYGLGGAVQRVAGGSWPWGTFVVNIIGCLLFGLVWAATEDRLSLNGEARLYVLTGFMGAFTTFSTFAFETSAMLRDSEYLLAAANLCAHNLIGIAFLFAGLALGRLI